MSVSLIVSLSALAAALSCGVWVLLSTRRRPVLVPEEAAWLTQRELASFEERLKHCEEVVLLADRVDIPTRKFLPEFLRALIDNFAEGVRYRFIVPPSFFDDNAERVTQSYYGIINLVRAAEGGDADPRQLFQLIRKPYEPMQADFPYLFYRYRDEDGSPLVVAFRGEDEGRGVASHYRRLEPEVARTIFSQVISYLPAADETVTLGDADFIRASAPIDLSEVRKRRAGSQ